MKIANNKSITLVVMCGGYGTRLWPISSDDYPKSFLKADDNFSFFQKSLLLSNSIKNVDNILVITNYRHRFNVTNQIESLKLQKRMKQTMI